MGDGSDMALTGMGSIPLLSLERGRKKRQSSEQRLCPADGRFSDSGGLLFMKPFLFIFGVILKSIADLPAQAFALPGRSAIPIQIFS